MQIEYKHMKDRDIERLLLDCSVEGNNDWELVSVTYVVTRVDDPVYDPGHDGGHDGRMHGHYLAVLKLVHYPL